MIRWSLVLLVSLLCLSSASASLDRRARPDLGRHIPVKAVSAATAAAAANDEYRITPNTQVLLDGRSCRYEQVPSSATIILLETVSNESKEIARIHFSTTRRPASPNTSR